MKKLPHEKMDDAICGTLGMPKLIEAFERDVKKFYSNISPDDPYKEAVESDLASGDWSDIIQQYAYRDFQKSYTYMARCRAKYTHAVYEVERDLAFALAHSDVSIHSDKIKFPASNMIIYLKDTPLKHLGKSWGRRWVPVYQRLEYIMLQVIPKPNQNGTLIQFILGTRDEGTDPSNLESWSYTTIYRVVFGNGHHVSVANTKHEFDDRNKFSEETKEVLSNEHNEIINLIWGLVLYLQFKPDDVVKHVPSDHSKMVNPKKLRKAEEETRSIIYNVGGKYAGIARGVGQSIDKKFLVSGHWRNQWYGSKKDGFPGTYQKPVWIEPYYKGIEHEEGLTPIHRVRMN